MKYILNKIASLLHSLGNWIEGSSPIPISVLAPPIQAELIPVKIDSKRDIDETKRKLLMLLAKDNLTESEESEINELTAGKEVIILEDT